MQDLLILDELVGLQQSRASKREQVSHVQSLLDNAETLKSKISSLEVEIQPLASQQKQDEELDKMADEEFANMIAQKAAASTAASTEHPPPPQPIHPPVPEKVPEPVLPTEKPKSTGMDHPGIQKIHPSPDLPTEERTTIPLQRRNDTVAHPRFDLKDAWSKLRLDPKVQIFEGGEEYTIMANIPGIHKDEIETTILPDGTLQLSGIRIPTPEEINLLRKQIHSRYTPKSDEEEDMLVLKLGVGRFGRFMKKFRLPTDLNIDQIHGQYKDGIVYISIPKPANMKKQREIPKQYPFVPFMYDVPFWDNSRYY
jgi:HSP20 family molecular chaperone IbpA